VFKGTPPYLLEITEMLNFEKGAGGVVTHREQTKKPYPPLFPKALKKRLNASETKSKKTTTHFFKKTKKD
jgi:hypothetical protein